MNKQKKGKKFGEIKLMGNGRGMLSYFDNIFEVPYEFTLSI